tara:strand:- start:2795 stop:3031 length:237 start_codon:yes stop_codon:yes gene_type:complete
MINETPQSALKKLKKLDPIQFKYLKNIDPQQKLRAGFSAQQVKDVIPEAVQEIDGILAIKTYILLEYVELAKKALEKL